MGTHARPLGASWADKVEMEEVEEEGEEETTDSDFVAEDGCDEDEEEEDEEEGEEEGAEDSGDDGSRNYVVGDGGLNGGDSHSDPGSTSCKKRMKLRSYGSNDLEKELLEEDIWETQSLETCSAGVCVNASLKYSDQIQQDQSLELDATDVESLGTDLGDAHGAMVEEEGSQGCCSPAVFSSAELSALDSAVQSQPGTIMLKQASSDICPQESQDDRRPTQVVRSHGPTTSSTVISPTAAGADLSAVLSAEQSAKILQSMNPSV